MNSSNAKLVLNLCAFCVVVDKQGFFIPTGAAGINHKPATKGNAVASVHHGGSNHNGVEHEFDRRKRAIIWLV